MDLTFTLAGDWAAGAEWDDALVMGEPAGSMVSVFQVVGGTPSAYPRIVLLAMVDGAMVQVDEFSPGAHDGQTGSSSFDDPHMAYVNGRWVAMWPHFVDSSDALTYYIAVWTHTGNDLVVELSEYVTVPYAHTLGSVMYGIVMGVLDDCVILNAGYLLDAERHFYSRVVPVGPGSAATASSSDSVLSGTGAGAPLYAHTWTPAGSSVRFHWNVDELPAGSYVITKSGAATWETDSVGGWYYSNPYAPGVQSVVAGETHRFAPLSGVGSWLRLSSSGGTVQTVPGYANTSGSAAHTVAKFQGLHFATERQNVSGGYPSGFYSVLVADLYGADRTVYTQSALPGTNTYVTRLSVVATSGRLLLAGLDFLNDRIRFWEVGGIHEVSNLAGELGRGRYAFT